MFIPIQARDLTKIYKKGPIEVGAVLSANLQLNEGEIVGLTGPSGSGKTTLLSMLGCILRPTRGSLQIFGAEITKLKPRALPGIRKKYISFIFQGFNLLPFLTAYQNVALILRLKGYQDGKHMNERVKELLSKVGLSDRMHFYPKALSGGQKQRVAIARALAADAPVVLADEPTGSLDNANGQSVMEILRKLANEEKKCVIVATHDNRIEHFFDRIVFMEDGKIAEIGKRMLLQEDHEEP